MRAASGLVLIILLNLPIHATTVKRLDLDGLVAIADTIVVGEVRRSEIYWSVDGRLILTRHTIQVDETLKGFPAGTVEVTTVGGTIGDRTLYVAGMPAFADRERTILFLEAAGSYRTVPEPKAQRNCRAGSGEVLGRRRCYLERCQRTPVCGR